MQKVLVFTDLDGTLLDEETYLADSSLDALRDLQAADIPVVFCSSKTRKEQEVIRAILGVNDPFIAENGSVILVPPNTVDIGDKTGKKINGVTAIVLGLPIEELRPALKRISSITGIEYRSFCDLSGDEIVAITGLDLESALLAKTREYSETIVTQFNVSDLETFRSQCELNGLQTTFGGRFLSVTGKGADKGKAVQVLTKYYQRQFNEVVTVGIGDSPNDASMLSEVDHPYLVQRPDGRWRKIDVPNLSYLPAIGPLGFAAMVKELRHRWPDQRWRC